MVEAAVVAPVEATAVEAAAVKAAVEAAVVCSNTIVFCLMIVVVRHAAGSNNRK